MKLKCIHHKNLVMIPADQVPMPPTPERVAVGVETVQINNSEGAAEGVVDGAEAAVPFEQPTHPIDPAFERLMTIRRVRRFPISFASNTIFNFGVVRFLMWPTHFRLYSWAVMSLDTALDMYNVTKRDFIWRITATSYIKVDANMREPQFVIIYYADQIWTMIYKNSIRKEERLRRMRFIY